MIVFHNITTKLLRIKCGPASSDLWSYCIGEVFVPVQIETKLHKLFQSGSFSAFRHFRYCTTGRQAHMWQNIQLLLLDEGEMFPTSHVAFVRNTWQQSKNVAACWIWVLSRCARRLSCAKLCELERRGACLHPVLGIVVCPPFFESTPSVAPPEHFCSLFGLPEVFTGCSIIGRVAVRCTNWNTAVTLSSTIDFIVQAKLAFLVQCYPKQLEGMPIGTRCSDKFRPTRLRHC